MIPDLIDKPLYYGCSLATGLRGAEMGLISGTRTFGHTALFAGVLGIVALWRKTPTWAALALGNASHLLIDHLWDAIFGPKHDAGIRLQGLLWPFLGNDFPDYPFHNLADHMERFTANPALIGEGIGALLLTLQLRSYFLNERRPQTVSRRARRRG